VLQTPSTTTNGSRQSREAGDSQADTASRQQLHQLAEAMQQQLDMLAHAVAELRQVGACSADSIAGCLATRCPQALP
jgi:hypothetical protein